MKRLTEANYQSRRIKLTEALVEAKTAHSDLGLRREMGMASDEQVRTARDEMLALEDRIVSLDAAWDRTLEMLAADRAAAEVATAGSAYAQINELLQERNGIAAEMEDAARAVADRYNAYALAGDRIKQLALANRTRFSGERLQNLREVLDGGFNDIRQPLSRVLGSSGLDLTGFAFRGYATDHPYQQSVRALADWQGTRIAGHAAVLVQQENA